MPWGSVRTPNPCGTHSRLLADRSEAYAVRDRVGVGRVELPTLAGYASEAYAYTNSATRPLDLGKFKQTNSSTYRLPPATAIAVYSAPDEN